jgi:hypothetical protein
MREMEEHLKDEFPKVERTEVEFNKKESLKHCIVSDEQLRAHFQDEIKAIHFSSESKSKLKKVESKRATYFWISAMAAGWAIALVLRTFIVVTQEVSPIKCVYQPSEKKIEKNTQPPDTIYTLSAEGLLQLDDINFPLYSGGSDFPDMWSPANGCGFPNGTMPWSSLVSVPAVDSIESIPIKVNQDSLLLAKIDSNLQQMKSRKQTKEYITAREFIVHEIDKRVQKIRKVREFFRAARLSNRDDHEDKLVIEWKGRSVRF